MQYVVSEQSGQVIRFGSAGQEANEGERVVTLDYQIEYPSSVYFVGDAPLPLPERSQPYLSWDPALEEWVDLRSAERIAAELEVWRSGRSLSKVEFGQRCVALQILHHDEFAPAMRGEIPSSFQSAVDAMSGEMRDMAAGIWAGSVNINRLDPFIVEVARLKEIPDEVLDILFGDMPGFAPL